MCREEDKIIIPLFFRFFTLNSFRLFTLLNSSLLSKTTFFPHNNQQWL